MLNQLMSHFYFPTMEIIASFCHELHYFQDFCQGKCYLRTHMYQLASPSGGNKKPKPLPHLIRTATICGVYLQKPKSLKGASSLFSPLQIKRKRNTEYKSQMNKNYAIQCSYTFISYQCLCVTQNGLYCHQQYLHIKCIAEEQIFSAINSVLHVVCCLAIDENI